MAADPGLTVVETTLQKKRKPLKVKGLHNCSARSDCNSLIIGSFSRAATSLTPVSSDFEVHGWEPKYQNDPFIRPCLT